MSLRFITFFTTLLLLTGVNSFKSNWAHLELLDSSHFQNEEKPGLQSSKSKLKNGPGSETECEFLGTAIDINGKRFNAFKTASAEGIIVSGVQYTQWEFGREDGGLGLDATYDFNRNTGFNDGRTVQFTEAMENQGNGVHYTLEEGVNNVDAVIVSNDENGPTGDGFESFSIIPRNEFGDSLGIQTFIALDNFNENWQTFEFDEIYHNVYSFDFIINTVYDRLPLDFSEVVIATTGDPCEIAGERIELLKGASIEDTNENGFVDAGDVVNYQFTINNTGSSRVVAITVEDDKLDEVLGGPINLDIGASDDSSFTGSYTLTQQDIEDGFFENTATATGQPVDENGAPIDVNNDGIFTNDLISDVSDASTDAELITITDPSDTETSFPDGTLPNDPDDTCDDPTVVALELVPRIELIKSVSRVENTNDNEFTDAGDIIHYGFRVTNTGNTVLSNITIDDPEIDVSGELSRLEIGESRSDVFSGSYTILQSDVEAMIVENTATANATPIKSDGEPFDVMDVQDISDTGTDSNQNEITDPSTTETEDPNGTLPNDTNDPTDDPTTLTIVPMPDLSILKGVSNIIDVNGNDFTDAGDIVEYIFTITNTGNTPLIDISVMDDKIAVVGELDFLDINESNNTAFSGQYTVTQSDVEAMMVENSATASATPANSNGDPLDLPDVSDVSDASTDSEAEEIDNPAEDENENPNGNLPNDENDPTDDPTFLTITPMPDMELIKSIGELEDLNGNGFIDAGDIIVYTFEIINTGNTVLSNITIEDDLIDIQGGPIELGLEESNSAEFSGSYVVTQRDVENKIVENTATTRATPFDSNGQPLGLPDITDISDTGTDSNSNQVNDPLTTETDDPNGSIPDDPNDPADDPTTFALTPMPRIELIKSIDEIIDANNNGVTDIGDEVTYIFTVFNSGNTLLINVDVEDEKILVDGGPIVLRIGETDSTEFKGTYTLTKEDIVNGFIENTAVSIATPVDSDGNPIDLDDVSDVSDAGTDSDGNTVDNPNETETDNVNGELPNDPDDPTNDPTSFNIESEPRIQLIKKVTEVIDNNRNGLKDTGDEIVYSFEVTNIGNTNLGDITITDEILGIEQEACTTTLEIGEMFTCEIQGSYIVSPEDYDNGAFENSAIATATPVDQNGDAKQDPDNPGEVLPDVTDTSDTGTDPKTLELIDQPNNIETEDADFVNGDNNDFDPTNDPTTVIFDCPALTCNGNVQISLDDECGGVVPRMFIQTDYPRGFTMEITLEDGSVIVVTSPDDSQEFVDADGNPFDWSPYVGQTISYRLISDCDGNSCWGNATIESNIVPNFDDQPCSQYVSGFELEGDLVPGDSVVVFTAEQMTAADTISEITGKTIEIVINEDTLTLPLASPVNMRGSVTKVAVEAGSEYPAGWANVRCEYTIAHDTTGAIVLKSELIDNDTNNPFSGTLIAPDKDITCPYSVEFEGCFECVTWCVGDELGDTAVQLGSGTVSNTVDLLDREDILAMFGIGCRPELEDLEARIIDDGNNCSGNRVVEWVAEWTQHGVKETRVLFSQGFKLEPIQLSSIDIPSRKELNCGDDYSPEGLGGRPTFINVHRKTDPECIPYEMHYTVVAGVEDKKLLVNDQWIVIPVIVKEPKVDTFCVNNPSEIEPILELLKAFPATGKTTDVVGSLASFVSFEAISGNLEEVIVALEQQEETFDTSLFLTGGGEFVRQEIDNSACNIVVNYSDSDSIGVCGGGFKVFRKWTILDWCSGEKIDTIQPIDVSDSQDPMVVSAPEDTVRLSISPWTCEVDMDMVAELVEFSDNCDETIEKTVSISGYLENVGVGLYTAIVKGTDDCGNSHSVEVYIDVYDGVIPIPVCQDVVVASLTDNPNEEDSGAAKVFAEAFDAGSHDSDCGSLEVCVVRMEDVSEEIRDCRGLVGYAPKTCGVNVREVALYAEDENGNCVPSGETVMITDECGEYVKFCCEDIGGENMVRVTYTDEAGNSNLCMVPVDVVDKSASSCSDSVVEMTCVEDMDDKVHTPKIDGASCGANFVYDDSGELNGCSQGTIFRTWYSDEDGSGDYSEGDRYKCVTEVRVTAATTFDPKNIKWPKHYDGSVVDGLRLDCNDQDEETGEEKSIEMGDSFNCVPDADVLAPAWCDYSCGLIAYEHKDDTLKASDACLKIVRRWTVIDWCLYEANGADPDIDESDAFEAVEDHTQGVCSDCEKDGKPVIQDSVYFRYTDVDVDGYYTYGQVIKVVDDMAPEISVADTVYVDIEGGSKSADDQTVCLGSGVISATASDFCGGQMHSADGLEWTITRGDIEFSERGAEATISTGESTAGTEVTVEWSVKDGCGNSASAQTLVIFRDQKAPTPVCIANLETVVSENGEVEVWAKDFDRGSFDNCTSSEDIFFALIRAGESFDFDEALDGQYDKIALNCDNIGNTNLFGMEMYVIDAQGNYDYCQVHLLVADHNNYCNTVESESALISGVVSNEFGNVIAGVEVELDATLDEYPRSFTTDASGRYQFEDIVKGENYLLKAGKQDSYIEGVSTIDLVLIQKHILGLKDLDSPYQILASDANGSGTISTIDIVELRKLILGIKTELDKAPAWRFIDARDDMTDDPFNYDGEIALYSLTQNMPALDWIGVKTGDVNVSANTVEPRANGTVQMTVEEVEFEAGQRIEVPVRSADFGDVLGYQMTMRHEGLELVDIVGGALDIDLENIGQHKEFSTMSWHDAQSIEIDHELFTLVFRATQSGRLSEQLSVDIDGLTHNEAYVGGNLDRKTVTLAVTSDNSVVEQGYELYQNEPNPFVQETTIGFDLPNAGEAHLTIFDASGKVLYEIEDDFNAGHNEVNVTKAQIQVNGILYYQLQSGEFTATKKMVVIE